MKLSKITSISIKNRLAKKILNTQNPKMVYTEFINLLNSKIDELEIPLNYKIELKYLPFELPVWDTWDNSFIPLFDENFFYYSDITVFVYRFNNKFVISQPRSPEFELIYRKAIIPYIYYFEPSFLYFTNIEVQDFLYKDTIAVVTGTYDGEPIRTEGYSVIHFNPKFKSKYNLQWFMSFNFDQGGIMIEMNKPFTEYLKDIKEYFEFDTDWTDINFYKGMNDKVTIALSRNYDFTRKYQNEMSNTSLNFNQIPGHEEIDMEGLIDQFNQGIFDQDEF